MRGTPSPPATDAIPWSTRSPRRRRALLVLETIWYVAAFAVIVGSGRGASSPWTPAWVGYWVMAGLSAGCAVAAGTRWWRPRWTMPVALGELVLALVTAPVPFTAPLTPWRWMLCGAVLPVLLTAAVRRGGRVTAPVAVAIAVAAAAVDGRGGGDTVSLEAARLLGGTPPSPPLVLATGLVVLLVPVVWGLLLRSTDTAERVERLARIRAEERLAVARDLHDTVASQVGGIVLTAQGVGMSADPAAVRRGVTVIEQTGQRALAEMARMVDALRTADRDGDGRPGPDGLAGPMAGPEEAVRAAIGEEPRVSLRLAPAPENASSGAATGTRSDDHGPVRPEVLVALHRISLEAVSNARRHGPAGSPIAVDLSARGAGDLVLEVVNDLPTTSGHASGTPGGGHGLLGVRERASALGGRLEVGPDGDGRWRLRAVLPRRPPDDVP